uniref:Uncharacterized protein n=1 Tax=Aegilops tauschii TaxID=37682 RepID=M8CGZ1_AEGTA
MSEPPSVAGAGSWRLSLIPEHTPVHLMLPVDGREKAILVSIHGPGGNHTKSDPYPCMPAIQGERLTATASSGAGPLIFVDLDTDGKYHYGT